LAQRRYALLALMYNDYKTYTQLQRDRFIVVGQLLQQCQTGWGSERFIHKFFNDLTPITMRKRINKHKI